MASGAERTITLVSSDGQRHVVSCQMVRVFRALDTMIQALGTNADEPIPLNIVSSVMLNKILAWADHYMSTLSSTDSPMSHDDHMTQSHDHPPSSSPIQPQVFGPKVPKRKPQMPSPVVTPTEWERDFLEKNREELYDLLLAANYLDAKRLMDILCARVAESIKGKDPALIRKTFHVPEPNDS